ncbi:GTP-binding protein [Astrocystis sublimbata]|nr:GTP-binding protein [Astrocystis sublimbata]
MAAVFTFSDEPPRVSSPWEAGQEAGRRSNSERCLSTSALVDSEPASDSEVDRLEAEPQEGPIEYKLHLLLRPRRAYQKMSTTAGLVGSGVHKKLQQARAQPVLLASSNQTRQNRLHRLTTQLLWRLKQSSPEHATAKGDLVIPQLPEDNTELATLQEPRQLLPGLEESNGALYEIGVADDGTFVGLTKEEMDDSMTTLKVMAASLGCRVEVRRMKAVGTCEWLDRTQSSQPQLRCEDLWVAEALVMPIILDRSSGTAANDDNEALRRGASTVEQLRVLLTGPTTSGKTTLLGTLANGTLDDGKGRSRSYLLKHRHEVASGRTSSIAQELIGYEDRSVFNYTCMDSKAWPDIHDRAQDGRLVFLLDSAGHPRYQRTTLRALVGWAPHWTLLCIAASDEDAITTGTHLLTGVDGPPSDGVAGIELAMAHLDLCLKLQIPLVILITKLDKTQRPELKGKLSKIFTKTKATGRTPKLFTGSASADCSEISDRDQAQIQTEVIDAITQTRDPLAVVPVVLTSAIKGDGIGLIHAFLASLPVPPAPTAQDFVPLALNPEQPAALFHIDEVFELARSRAQSTQGQNADDRAPVVTGYLRFGRLSIGDQVVLGPFPAEDDDAGAALVPNDQPSPGYGLSLPHPSSAEYARWSVRNAVSASKIEGEWRNATIINIRELRLPVRSIEAGQAGSIQVVFDALDEGPSDPDEHPLEKQSSSAPRIRKGQVMAMPSRHMIETGLSLQASTGFTASFTTEDVQSLAAGSLVNAYVGMVRAAVRVLRVSQQKSQFDPRQARSEDHDDIFGMSDHIELQRTRSEADLETFHAEYHVKLELLSNREWIELGSRVVLLEGGIKDKSGGLDALVGKVIEVIE